MAELVDAPASGAGDRKVVEVRVLFRAPFYTSTPGRGGSRDPLCRCLTCRIMLLRCSHRNDRRGMAWSRHPAVAGEARFRADCERVRCHRRSVLTVSNSDLILGTIRRMAGLRSQARDAVTARARPNWIGRRECCAGGRAGGGALQGFSVAQPAHGETTHDLRSAADRLGEGEPWSRQSGEAIH